MTGSKKTDNHDPRGKLALRRYFLDTYHADGLADVLDCCQGGGVMWNELRKTHTVQSYWGVDLKQKKGRLKLDSVRILQQPGWTQNVVDVDAYGSPWKHWFAMLPNITQPTTVFLTIGATMFKGATDGAVLKAIGCQFATKLPEVFCGKLSDFGAKYCLAKGCNDDTIITEAVEAVSTGNAQYWGVRIQPRKWNGQQVQTAGRSEHTQSGKGIEHV